MALFIGENRVTIILNNQKYRVNISSSASAIVGKKIILSNNETLKTSDGKYITLKEE